MVVLNKIIFYYLIIIHYCIKLSCNEKEVLMNKIPIPFKFLINTFPLVYWIIVLIFDILQLPINNTNDALFTIMLLITLSLFFFPMFVFPFISILINCILAKDIKQLLYLSAFSFFTQIFGLFISTFKQWSINFSWPIIKCIFTSFSIIIFDIIGISIYLLIHYSRKSKKEKIK